MRKAAVGLVGLAVALAALSAVKLRAGEGSMRNKVEGTWEHTFPFQPRLRQIKVINQDHFIWVTYDKESRAPLTTAGGSYTLEGDAYKERMEFGRFGTDELQKTVGKEQTFRVRIEGDTMYLTGTLSNGQRLAEVWKRVRP